ncbi:ABC transporter permease [Alphaproteobacteria bacterium]|nr:ABC transporter permease [Alphaproteobacteria bacterium]
MNVLGLSVAFAAFMIMMMQVNYEWNFDRSHPNAERIFRLDLQRGEATESILARGLVDAVIASSPNVEEGTMLLPLSSYTGGSYITVGDSSDRKGFREPFATCYSNITHIFGFNMVEGDRDCLNDPEKAIIPQSMAHRLFGSTPATGKAIHLNDQVWTKDERDLTVGGVYKDFPGNTQLDNVIYTAIDNHTQVNDWNMSNYICYLLLDSKQSAGTLVESVNQTFDFSPVSNPYGLKIGIQLFPLTDIYHHNDAGSFGGSVFKQGNGNTVRILFFIALLVIIIAAINFTNFSIALAPMRIKSINTQKILGSSTAVLRCALLSEALAIALTAWIISLFIVGVLEHNWLISFIEADMNPMHNLGLLFLVGAIALSIGLIAGLYPAWYTTSFQPSMVLKGRFAMSPAGRFLRTGLIGFQYVISIGLIIAAIFIQFQNKYMRDYDQGFDKDQIAIVELNSGMYKKSKDAYVNKLKEYSGIESVAFSKQKLGASDQYATYNLTHIDQNYGSFVLEVSPDFLDVMGIRVLEGRNFLPSDEQQDDKLIFIFNKAVQDGLQAEVGSMVSMGRNQSGYTAGFVGDVKLTSLRKEPDHISFMVQSEVALPVSYIRLKAGTNIVEAVAHIRESVAAIDPTYPFDIEFYDAIFDRLYHREESLNKSITLLSVLAITISIVGVFGLVLFETQYRRKEISIRKVHGATVSQILGMFNKVYFRIVCICFIMAAPVAYYAVTRWLENFAYKTPLYWWVFIASFAIVTAITLATVTFQNWQAANTNPVKSIKAE